MSWVDDSLLLGCKTRLAALGIGWKGLEIMPVLSIAAGLFLAFTLQLVVYRAWLHPLSKIPGPVMNSVFNFPYIWRNNIRGLFVFDSVQVHRKYGPIVRIGPERILVDGEIAWPQVFSRRKADQGQFEKMMPTQPVMGNSMTNARYHVHLRQRRHISPAFSDASIKQQEPVVKGYIDLLMDRLQKVAEKGEPVNMVNWLNCTTFDIAGDLVFTESFRSLRNSAAHPWFAEIMESVRYISFQRFLDYYPLVRKLASLFVSTLGGKESPGRSHAKQKAQKRMDLGEEGPQGRKDMVSYMLRKTRDGQVVMRPEEVLENSVSLIVAGSETMSSALCAFWFYLAKNPRVYERLAKEIRRAFPSEDEIRMQKASQLEYLQACISEALRVYPPAAETPSRVSPGALIEGVYIPRGTLITVFQWATFRNPKHFREPDSFIPERWLSSSHPHYEERFKDENHAVFQPFSFGPRDCIGKNLALNELRLIISRILFKFDYELSEGQDDWHTKQRAFLMWDKGPLMVRFKKRQMTVGEASW
ncbi:uncharacterized protein UV8b_00579 [Ustilaginoidea virens]|uniref:Cytochrome P450 n=1 Tax=Ustilaginoidea virens TaxID=1159556 RepID=A0A8E5MDL2_USTVR|nr:uncharacterized protein UV8b_00579 [Ustilaginoidea virens]QUC16338.1 hypothetical protein UV8b_00579 [Ustilaginoidea virens]